MDNGYYKGQQLKGSAKYFRKAEFTNTSIELSNVINQWKEYSKKSGKPPPSAKKWQVQVEKVEV